MQGAGCSAIILRLMLSKMSLRNTFLVFSGVQVVLLSIAYLLVEGRPKAARSRAGLPGKIIWIDSKLFKDPVFWSLTLSLVVSVL